MPRQKREKSGTGICHVMLRVNTESPVHQKNQQIIMKKYLIILSVLVCFVGCCSYKNVPYVVYRDNEIDEFIGPMKDYCIYDFISQVKMRRDTEVYFPAHYHILFPPKRGIKNILGYNDNRCFIYTKSRGIAIFQDHYSWERKHANGFRQIPADSASSQLSLFDDQVEIKVKEQKDHYLYVDNEIRIVFFNISEKDYQSFVEFPLKSLEIKRRGEVRED